MATTLSPMSTFQTYFQRALRQLDNPGFIRRQVESKAAQAAEKAAADQGPSLVQLARNIDRAQLVKGGVVVAEVLGFFTVGEMIGRMKIIGYHGDTGAHH